MDGCSIAAVDNRPRYSSASERAVVPPAVALLRHIGPGDAASSAPPAVRITHTGPIRHVPLPVLTGPLEAARPAAGGFASEAEWHGRRTFLTAPAQARLAERG